MASRGRPQKPYPASWGEHITGLARDKDKRWRIVETGYRFYEPDERIAVKRFYEWQAKTYPPQLLNVSVPATPENLRTLASNVPTITSDGEPVRRKQAEAEVRQVAIATEMYGRAAKNREVMIHWPLPSDPVWKLFRDMILTDPVTVAKNTGIPELAHYARLPLPRPSITIASIITNYQTHSSAKTAYAKQQAITCLKRLIAHSKALTLDDLTTPMLLAFKDAIESDKDLKEGSSRAGIYRKIKTVIAFGLKRGMDATQIRSCLDRCKVLWTASPDSQVDPHPISRENLHLLLKAANGKYESWKAWMLIAINCSLKMGDVCRLQWSSLDLAKKTYCTIREKTQNKKIPQAAVLWDETVTVLKEIRAAQLKRKIQSPYVFVSPHGTCWNRNGKGDQFGKFRDAAGVLREDGTKVCFDDFRDGGYTACCQSGCDNRLCRVMAGHRAEGYQDNYVLRNPALVKPATDAVYAVYFGAEAK